MPLKQGNTAEVISHNIAELLATGKYTREQAAAIAYNASAQDSAEAAGIMYHANGKMLFVKRSPASVHGDTWAFPGGKVESGETTEQAAIREFNEETGFTPETAPSFLGKYDNFALFKITGTEFTPQLNDEHTEYLWADSSSLPSPLHPNVAKQLSDNGMDYASARVPDINGWYEIKKNPLSKVGVYPYLGRSIDPRGDMGLEPDQMYNVLRPREELSDPECIESFKLIPWIIGHTMLGSGTSGYTPAEEKGIHGVIGENVFFENDTLYGNIKWFSDSMSQTIDADIKELSMGYRCIYEKSAGVYNGTRYDVVQRRIRGNHVALVPEGRMGHEVAVLDHLMNFTFDAKEIKMADKTEEEKKTEAAKERAAQDGYAKYAGDEDADKDKDKDKVDAKDGKGKDSDADPKEDADKDKDKDKEGKGMDARDKQIKSLETTVMDLKEKVQTNTFKAVVSQIKERDTLAGQIAQHVGAFDHSEMTIEEVAAYGVKAFGIACDESMKVPMLKGYLHNRQAPAKQVGFAIDAKQVKAGADEVDNYINSAQA